MQIWDIGYRISECRHNVPEGKILPSENGAGMGKNGRCGRLLPRCYEEGAARRIGDPGEPRKQSYIEAGLAQPSTLKQTVALSLRSARSECN